MHIDAAHNLASLLQRRSGYNTTNRKSLLFEAAGLYRQVLRQDNERWDAWANLGSAILHSEQADLDAARCLQRAILLIEKSAQDNEQIRQATATAYFGLGSALIRFDQDEAQKAFDDEDFILLRFDNPQIAVLETAQNALRTAIALCGNNNQVLKAKAEHALMIATNSTTSSRASPLFVKALFDDFAQDFDDRLIGDLQYRVPQLIAQALMARRRKYCGFLDAGCGTGLAALELIDRSILNKNATIIGVDLSDSMIAKAQVRGIYDALLVGDLCDDSIYQRLVPEFISNPLDLIVAADVFCYLGDLEPLLSRFSQNLSIEGDLIFTVETLNSNNQNTEHWALGPSGRYAHSPKYIANLATSLGLSCIELQSIVARLENSKPVNSTLFLFQKKKNPQRRE
eukprot:CAMPEP_0197309444 /NCGR_PEP_ID=MMETSP0891-20130614/8023_1 /TAXON_ID=44058 ORGANISM="Aureoumbra lagunensis, Strain CCMP1510" /NCGR_SAMPLE_ID=MMETSP0891 /ASSEMBLY_ACC=CAM_ASM_000534 /LENGTH=398 /DNA_ID=CAMNT_0042794505 /DNA_START=255 /DNA_END=1451 /DNA_ORIENTATION=+